MGGKVCLRCKRKTLLGIVNKLLTPPLLSRADVVYGQPKCWLSLRICPKFNKELVVLHSKMRSTPSIWLGTQLFWLGPDVPWSSFSVLNLGSNRDVSELEANLLKNSKIVLTFYCSLSQIIACIILFSYLIHTNYAAIVIFYWSRSHLPTFIFHHIPIFFYSNMPSTYFASFWIATWLIKCRE